MTGFDITSTFEALYLVEIGAAAIQIYCSTYLEQHNHNKRCAHTRFQHSWILQAPR